MFDCQDEVIFGTIYDPNQLFKERINMKIDLQPNEMVVKAGDSTFLNGQKVPGKLIITNQRIYFISIEMEHLAYNQKVEPSDIKEVLPFKTGFFSSNGLNIVTKGGKELMFSVKERPAWEQMINKMY